VAVGAEGATGAELKDVWRPISAGAEMGDLDIGGIVPVGGLVDNEAPVGGGTNRTVEVELSVWAGGGGIGTVPVGGLVDNDAPVTGGANGLAGITLTGGLGIEGTDGVAGAGMFDTGILGVGMLGTAGATAMGIAGDSAFGDATGNGGGV
jgi:hypothetical protein